MRRTGLLPFISSVRKWREGTGGIDDDGAIEGLEAALEVLALDAMLEVMTEVGGCDAVNVIPFGTVTLHALKTRQIGNTKMQHSHSAHSTHESHSTTIYQSVSTRKRKKRGEQTGCGGTYHSCDLPRTQIRQHQLRKFPGSHARRRGSQHILLRFGGRIRTPRDIDRGIDGCDGFYGTTACKCIRVDKC